MNVIDREATNSEVWKALEKPLNTGLNLPGQNVAKRFILIPGNQSINQSIDRSINTYYLLKSRESSDEGLTLETSAFQLVTVANLHFQLSWYNQITL